MCSIGVRRKKSEKRQSGNSNFFFFVMFGKYPPVSDEVQSPEYTGEAKIYRNHKLRNHAGKSCGSRFTLELEEKRAYHKVMMDTDMLNYDRPSYLK